jgi:hypothetical protein
MVMTLTGAAGKGIPIAGSWFVFFLARTPPSAKICNRKLDCSDDQAPVSLVVGFTMLKSSRQQARFQCGFAQTLEVVNTVCNLQLNVWLIKIHFNGEVSRFVNMLIRYSLASFLNLGFRLNVWTSSGVHWTNLWEFTLIGSSPGVLKTRTLPSAATCDVEYAIGSSRFASSGLVLGNMELLIIPMRMSL